MPIDNSEVPSSFRDPSGSLFYRDGVLYRQINLIYKNTYDTLMQSGLYASLIDDQLLIPHEEVDIEPSTTGIAYKIIRPQVIQIISYPYEWCFSQLKDAALTTLKVQRKALDFGMTLKDASAYNVQFLRGKPIFIDTLSFERYTESQPWVAYRQFCQHFLAPLALMSYKDIRLSQLLRTNIDGIPLDLASSLLPSRTRFKMSLLAHIHLHAGSQKHYANKTIGVSSKKISKTGFLGILDSLESTVKGLKWKPHGTEWAEYYNDTNYSTEAFKSKRDVITEFLSRLSPKNVWDLGGNIGIFSRIAANMGISTVSMDIDPAAVEMNYIEMISKNEMNIIPLVIDLINPSPAIGWGNEERMSLIERGPADAALALALIHHLAISNNVPFAMIANFFRNICNHLIIEFIPKSDSQVQRILATRDDIFTDYTQELFEREFQRYFIVKDRQAIKDSQRCLYLMQGK